MRLDDDVEDSEVDDLDEEDNVVLVEKDVVDNVATSY